jgi:hypothetical protein
VQSRAPLVLLLLGLIAGSIAGWVPHRAVSFGSESSVHEASHAISTSSALAESAEVGSGASALRRRTNSLSADSRPPTPASGSSILIPRHWVPRSWQEVARVTRLGGDARSICSQSTTTPAHHRFSGK